MIRRPPREFSRARSRTVFARAAWWIPLLAWLALSASVLFGADDAAAQTLPRPSAPPPAQAELPKDPLGRDTPRSAVLAFMSAGRKGNDQIAPLYLNTSLRDQAAIELAHKLFVVLDSRLPARLTELSDRREGSLANPLKPDEDVIATISTNDGPLDLTVERVSRGSLGQVWVFSRATLSHVPDLYDEVNLVSLDRLLPSFLERRIVGIRLFEWLALCVVLPLIYRLAALFDVLLRPAVAWWRRRRGDRSPVVGQLVPGAIRLLILAIAIRSFIRTVQMPLLERQFWTVIVIVLAIVAMVWLLLLVNEVAERQIALRMRRSGQFEAGAMLRLLRRLVDVVIVAAGVLVTLHAFGVDPTAALAGLGIGGIAVALSAQKTLENVIGGVSIIFDKAVRIGDFVKLGDTLGSVVYIGLRSTRIRTLDRTVLSVPNGQIANVNIETLSVRDKFWFRHVVCLTYETPAAQMRAVLDGIRVYLNAHPSVDRSESVRVRFFRLGPFSRDIELFAYVLAADWERFLEIQEELLIHVMDIVEQSGAAIALPSQTLQVTDLRVPAGAARPSSIAGALRRASRESAGTA